MRMTPVRGAGRDRRPERRTAPPKIGGTARSSARRPSWAARPGGSGGCGPASHAPPTPPPPARADAYLRPGGTFETGARAPWPTLPASRRHPQFARDTLAMMLEEAGIRYHHEPDLGGRRAARRDSANTAWRSAGFRGYADYMETPEFEDGLARLRELARARPTVILCAEAVPWRCHRQLIADALVARGEEVGHILGAARVDPHRLSPPAQVLTGGRP